MTSTTQTPTYPRYARYKDSGVEWLGEIPEGWELQKFRYLFSFGRGLSITKEHLQETGIPCVNYGEIHSKYGFEVDPEKHNLKCVSNDYLATSTNSLLQYGDFLFADTSEDISGSGNFTYLNSHEKVFAGYHTVIARPGNASSSRYMAYLFDSVPFRSQIQTRVKGVKVFSITQAILKDALLWLPPKEEQNRIVNFLDQKTTAIDTAIAKKQRLIELLKEQKAILINRAVTRGLNPEVPMKDSGVEWIGEIPAHWKVVKLSYIAKIDTGATPDRTNHQYWKGSIPWIKTGEVNYREIFDAEECITEMGLQNSAAKIAPVGTILMAMYGQGVTRGRVAILGVPAAYNQACAAIQVNNDIVYNKYIYSYFQAVYSFFRDSGNETSQMNLSSGYISTLKVPVPPIDEQIKIHQQCNHIISQLDSLMHIQQQQVNKLNEYKQTLVAHAVTGKIKV